jgi:OmpA-OmpF porin, OOP family
MRNSALALLLGLGVATASVAAETSESPYGAILGTYVLPDGIRDSDNGVGGKILYGLPLNKGVNLELNAFGNILYRNASPGVDNQYGLGVDLITPFGNGPVRPFLLGGFGGIYEQLGNSADKNSLAPYVNAGVGVLVKLSDRLSARAEATYLLDFNDSSYPNNSNTGDGRFSLGLQYAFFKPKPAPAPVVAPPPPPPPPAPVAPPPPPPPADADGDGVPDSRDECPNTPAGVKVDARGCPLDTDGDGVPDYLDQCPGTPKGFKVDSVGCIIEQTVVLRTVNFEFNKDTLTTEAKDTLDLVSAGMASQSKLTVIIAGHTDSVGADAYNQKLSQKRAEAVRAYMIGKGVAADRLRAEGYGESKPIASNADEAGRAENRRVEFQVLNKPLTVKIIKKGSTATKPRSGK